MSAKASKKGGRSPFSSLSIPSDLNKLSQFMDEDGENQASKFQELPLSLIDEDPDQPRKMFSEESLVELSESIKARGVMTPISVREHPSQPGRYIINLGERRFRASKMAEKTAIPAIIENDFMPADQMVENIHREALSAKEISQWIGNELAKGKTQAQIAHELRKSTMYVSLYAALTDLPSSIASAFESQRITDVTAAVELARLHKKDADRVESWLNQEDGEITRQKVKAIRLDEAERDETSASNIETEKDKKPDVEDFSEKMSKERSQKATSLPRSQKAVLQVLYQNREARLLLDRLAEEGSGWIEFEEDQEQVEVHLNELTLLAIQH